MDVVASGKKATHRTHTLCFYASPEPSVLDIFPAKLTAANFPHLHQQVWVAEVLDCLSCPGANTMHQNTVTCGTRFLS